MRLTKKGLSTGCSLLRLLWSALVHRNHLLLLPDLPPSLPSIGPDFRMTQGQPRYRLLNLRSKIKILDLRFIFEYPHLYRHISYAIAIEWISILNMGDCTKGHHASTLVVAAVALNQVVLIMVFVHKRSRRGIFDPDRK